MKEVERKDLPGITGGQLGPASTTVIPSIPNMPSFPQPGPTDSIDPFDPLGDGKRHVEA